MMSAAVSSTGVLVSEAAIIRTSRRLFPIISPAPAPKSMGMEMLWCAVYYRLLDDVENRGWRSLTLLKLNGQDQRPAIRLRLLCASPGFLFVQGGAAFIQFLRHGWAASINFTKMVQFFRSLTAIIARPKETSFAPIMNMEASEPRERRRCMRIGHVSSWNWKSLLA